jgi:hypothetical protein
MCICDFENVSLSDIFGGALTVIFVLLGFSSYAVHVGNRHVSEAAAGFCVLCCVLSFMCFSVKGLLITSIYML